MSNKNSKMKDQDNAQRPPVGQEAAPDDKAADPPASGSPEPQELPEPDPEVIVRELQEAQAKADDYWNQLLRTRAELDNLQRRSQKDLENAHKYGLEKFLSEFLPVRDSLELGLNAAHDPQADVAKLREGMELTVNLVQTLFEKFNIKEINPLGDKFNPEHHQAMSTQPAPDVEPNTVVMVYQKGYLLNDRLLRPALVVVSSQDGAGAGNSGKIDESA